MPKSPDQQRPRPPGPEVLDLRESENDKVAREIIENQNPQQIDPRFPPKLTEQEKRVKEAREQAVRAAAKPLKSRLKEIDATMAPPWPPHLKKEKGE